MKACGEQLHPAFPDQVGSSCFWPNMQFRKHRRQTVFLTPARHHYPVSLASVLAVWRRLFVCGSWAAAAGCPWGLVFLSQVRAMKLSCGFPLRAGRPGEGHQPRCSALAGCHATATHSNYSRQMNKLLPFPSPARPCPAQPGIS